MAEDIARLLNANSPDIDLVTSLMEDYLLVSDDSDSHSEDDHDVVPIPSPTVSDHDDDSDIELQKLDTETERNLEAKSNGYETVLTEEIDKELKKCQEFRYVILLLTSD